MFKQMAKLQIHVTCSFRLYGYHSLKTGIVEIQISVKLYLLAANVYYKSCGDIHNLPLNLESFQYLNGKSLNISPLVFISLILFLSMSLFLLDLSVTFTTKLPISLDLFLSKAGPRHFYGNLGSGCVLICKGQWKQFSLVSPSQVMQRETDTDFLKDRR